MADPIKPTTMLTDDEALVEQAAQFVLDNSKRGNASLNSEQFDADTTALMAAYRDIITKALPIIRTTDAARIAALEASLSYIARQWPDSSAAKHARATLRSKTHDR